MHGSFFLFVLYSLLGSLEDLFLVVIATVAIFATKTADRLMLWRMGYNKQKY